MKKWLFISAGVAGAAALLLKNKKDRAYVPMGGRNLTDFLKQESEAYR